ncbi:MAG: RNA polymerase sigma factor [Thermoguttaceae bacterium]|nr:RNA polymerase sigma factor [Thermoguttaceae bacterium]MDW8038563.1 RNA polymerase sigma factor [Thermoguttaceae bacterium]
MATEGNPLDIARLVAEHHEAVYRYAYRLSGSQPDAEDLTQQVFLIACGKGGQLRQADSVRSWLFTILRNCFLKSRAKPTPTPVGALELSLENLPEPEHPPPAIDSEQLQQALDRLSAQDRVILGMFYFENLSYREIAEQLKIPMGTVMSRLARAKARLRGQLFPQLVQQSTPPKTDQTGRQSPVPEKKLPVWP